MKFHSIAVHQFHSPRFRAIFSHVLPSSSFLTLLFFSLHVSPSPESYSADFPFSRVQGLVFKFQQQRLHAHCSLPLLRDDRPVPFSFFSLPLSLSLLHPGLKPPVCDACWRYAFVVIASRFFASPLFRKMVASLNGISFFPLFFFFLSHSTLSNPLDRRRRFGSRVRGKFGFEEFRVVVRAILSLEKCQEALSPRIFWEYWNLKNEKRWAFFFSRVRESFLFVL